MAKTYPQTDDPMSWGRIELDDEHHVDAEILRAIRKHGFSQTPMSKTMSDHEALVIVVEEVGEVARAMTYDEGSPEKLKEEWLQVAAMAYARYLSYG